MAVPVGTHSSGLGCYDMLRPGHCGTHKRAPGQYAGLQNEQRACEQIRSMQRGKLAQQTCQMVLRAAGCSPFASCLARRFCSRAGRVGAAGPK